MILFIWMLLILVGAICLVLFLCGAILALIPIFAAAAFLLCFLGFVYFKLFAGQHESVDNLTGEEDWDNESMSCDEPEYDYWNTLGEGFED